MQKFFFNFPSVTFALKSEKILKINNINTLVVKTPSQISSCGCGYSIVVEKKYLSLAKQLLEEKNIIITDIRPFEVQK